MRKTVKTLLVLVLMGSIVTMDCVAEKQAKQAKSVKKLKNKNNLKNTKKDVLKNTKVDKCKVDKPNVGELGKKISETQDLVKKDIVLRDDTSDNQLVLEPIQMVMSGGPVNTPERVLEAIEILLEFGNLTTQEIIRILSDVGADVNVVDRYGCTALHWAAKYGHLRCVEILLGAGVNVNTAGELHHRTALHRAARYAQIECVEMLLRAGAEIDLRDSGNQTALHRAFKGKHKLNELRISEAERSDCIRKYNLIIQLLVRHYLDNRKAISADLKPMLR